MSFDYSTLPLKDLNALYRWCNTRYFDNELPNNIPCQWNNRLSRARGRMIHRTRPPYNIKVDMATSLQNHPESILNTMVHEMVHVWQFHNHETTGNAWYLDESGLSRHLGMNPGHGPAFFSQMKRLNQGFPELRIDVLDDVLENERLTEKPLYGIHMAWHLANGRKLNSFFVLPGKPTMRQRETLQNQILSHLRPSRVQSIDLITSRHQYLADKERITKRFELRKNYRLKGGQDKNVKPFLEHETTQKIEPLFPDRPLDINRPDYADDLETVCMGLADCRGMSLVGFAQMFCKVMPYLKSHGDLPTGPTLVSGQCRRIPEAIVGRIKEEWFKGTKSDISKSDNVVNCIQKSSKAIQRKNPSELIDAIETAWMRAGPKRIARVNFAECLELQSEHLMDKETFDIFMRHLTQFIHAPVVMMKDKALAQGYRSLDDSYAQVLGHVVGAAISADIEIDDSLISRVQKMWDSPSKRQFQKTRTFEKAINHWGDMMRHPENDEWREDFECSIAKFGGRVDRKIFTQTVMVSHSQLNKDTNLKASRDMLKSFEKIPEADGQLVLEL